MPLDPQAKTFLDRLAAAGIPGYEAMALADARRLFRGVRNSSGPILTMDRVEDRTLGGVATRIYDPGGPSPKPAIVFLHGGGWVLGDLDTIDPVCRRLAVGSGCLVVSVDYRLAPEARFPAAVEDGFAATRAVAEEAEALGIDPARIAIGGDSSGGNLAASAALMARDRGGPPLAFQLLLYPALDPTGASPSYGEFAEGYGLTAVRMRWFWDQYLARPEDARHPYAAPARAEDLSGLPPALILAAECDVLRDEAEAYAARLRDQGVAVELRRSAGLIHGFAHLAGLLDAGGRALDEAAATVGEALRRPPA